jgi:sigma-54 dependent transcriptional regulator, acetoin dehydrogenase operon transcriptional activator AcoR
MDSPRILIVEDEQPVVDILLFMLTSLGYDFVSSVSTGEEAVARAEENRPDLVLMDIRLRGEMDGIEAAGQITSQFNIPVVYVTGSEQEDIIEKAKITEPYGYLIKPLSQRELHGAIEIALYKHEMTRRLRESEEKYREFAELLPQIVYEADLKGKFTFANRAGLAAVGYTSEDLALGLTTNDVFIPEDHERVTQSIRTILSGETHGGEYTALRKDGTTFPVLTHSAPIIRDGKVLGIRGVAIDVSELKKLQNDLLRAKDGLEKRVAERTAELVTANEHLRTEIHERQRAEEELRQSEELFRTIFETATDCIFIKDRSLKYTLVNAALANLLDLPGSSIVGLSDSELYGTDVSAHLEEIENRVLGGERIEQEHTRLVKDNLTTFLETRVPLRDSDGQVVGLCGIARNITERKHFTQIAGPSDHTYRSTAMLSTMDSARIAAETDSLILLTGESGTGKDYLARYIHENSKRSGGPYYAVNCAAIPTELAESELFGHEAGAFTGATKRKRGLLELAEGGTLLLNEIGELPPHLQAKLLTFLDTRSFNRVGGEKPVTVSARLIAATNRDLWREVQDGHFRADLFYRLNVLSIRVPALRDRIDDLPILVRQILGELSAELQFEIPSHIDVQGLDKLSRYPWPGNVRELRNVLERSLILSGSGRLDVAPLGVETSATASWPQRIGPGPEQSESFNDSVATFKRSLIEDALSRSGGKRQDAARLLGMTRHALKRQMKTLGYFEP